MNKNKLSDIDKIFPLTIMQQSLLFHNLKDERKNAYFNQHIIEMQGELDIDAFRKAISALSERFEIFRTRIIYKKIEKPVQVVLKHSEIDYEYIDLSDFSGDNQKAEIEQFLENDKEKGFNIDKDILCRITLIKLSDNRFINLWSYHHILMDGFCISIIADDFFKIYDCMKNNEKPDLSETVSYQVYESWLSHQDKDKALTYWNNYLKDYKGISVVPADKNESGEDIQIFISQLDDSVYKSVMRYCCENNITMNILVQCAWGILLQAYNDSEDVVFGGVTAARPLHLKDYDKIVGMFVNTLPVRVKTDSDTSLKKLLETLNTDFLNAVSNSYVSLGEIQSAGKFSGELVSHLYAFQNFSLDNLYSGAEKTGIKITGMHIKHTSNYDFTVEIIQREKFEFKITYNAKKYTLEYISKISDNFFALLENIAVSDISDIVELRKMVSVSPHIEKSVQENNFAEEQPYEYIAPSTELEIKLADIFRKVLGTERVGVTDDFFLMGGNSIKGMQVTALCEKQGIPLKLSELFVGCNISNIAKLIQKKNKSENKSEEKKPVPEDWYKPFPLNDIQKAYIIGQDSSFELGSFSPQYYTEFEGDIDIERLSESFDKVIEHQMALRTKIIDINNQIIVENMDKTEIPVIDATAYDEKSLNELLSSIRDSMSIHRVSIEDFPYFKLKAVKLKDNYYRICFNMDCLCVDGFGLGMMLQQIRDVYNNPEVEFKPIEFSVRDYSMYTEELKNSPKYQEDKKYWLDRVDTLPISLELPVNDTSEIRNPRFLRQEYLLSYDEYDRLKRFAAENKVTVPSVICAAYMEVLSFWSGQSKFTVNMTVFDRHNFNHDVENIIGDFTKLIYIESDTEPQSFIEKSRKVNANIISDLEHNTFNSMEMSRRITAKTSRGKKAILPYVFTCAINDDTKDVDMSFFKSIYAISRTPQVYIDNQVTQRGRSIFVNWDYPEGLFDEKFIENMFRQYIDILLNVSDNVKVKISDDDRKFIEKYNCTDLSEKETAEIAGTSLADFIRDSFEKYAENTAVKDSIHSITYRELDIMSDEVAFKLADDGLKAGDTIGIIGNRTVETVVNMIGAVKSGITYVPVNTEYPKERIKYMLEKSCCAKLINDDYVINDTDKCREFDYRKVNPESDAYIIFTSGSTGNPKGVVIKHNSAVNTIADINRKFNINQQDRLLCLASFGFDLSVYDVYGALSSGALLYICNQQKNPEELKAVIENEKITVWNSVPAVMQMLISCLKNEWKNETLRLVLMSGDWIPVKLPSEILHHFPNVVPISLGGATEGSIWSIYYPISDKLFDFGSIPYGMPLSNQKIYILDDKLEYCAVGVKGEICIGGMGVAQGYINNPEKTAAAFINHHELGYIYRTGDYGKLHNEGFIEFLGRKDTQVKIHGYRVELGEIEARASELEGVKQAVVLLKKQGAGASIKMFLESNEELDIEDIKNKLRKKLPEYMIPSFIVCMKQFPITQNGKTDRKQLLENSSDNSVVYRTEPLNEKEKLLSEIWCKILEIDSIELDRSLFETGVDSLKSIQFITEIKNMGYEVSLMDIYSNDTIEKLAAVLYETGVVSEEDGDMFEDGVL